MAALSLNFLAHYASADREWRVGSDGRRLNCERLLWRLTWPRFVFWPPISPDNIWTPRKTLAFEGWI